VSVLGLETGALVHVTAAAAGLSALVASSPAALAVLRYGGAGYLLWLGIRTLRRHAVETPAARAPASHGRLFRGPKAKAQRARVLTFSDELLPTDLAVRDWSRREPPVADRLRRVDNRRMDYLRSLLAPFCADEDELEARCLIAFSVAIGNHFIAADHGAHSRADVRELIARRLFAQ